MEMIDKNTVSAEAESQEDSLVLKFRKSYVFENREYTELDLSGLEDTTAEDLAAVNRLLSKSGVVSPMPEMTQDFCMHMAARVCHLPIEFFKKLPSREAIRLKNVVTGFLYGGDGEG